jgi:hypothetical protein
MGMERRGEDPHGLKSIDCSKREELEVLTLSLGGHDFSITPYEYPFELDIEDWGGNRCTSAFIAMPEWLD